MRLRYIPLLAISLLTMVACGDITEHSAPVASVEATNPTETVALIDPEVTAETVSQPPSSDDESNTPMVPSLIFVQYLNQQAPSLLCEQDATVKCMGMPTDLCMASVEQSAERCGPILLEQWPASFEENEENAVKYSQAYRQCIFSDWVENFGLDPKRLEACGTVLIP